MDTLETLKENAGWIVGFITTVAALAWKAWGNYKASKAKERAKERQEIRDNVDVSLKQRSEEVKVKAEEAKAKAIETDAYVVRLYQLLDRVQKEHAEDRIAFAKLHEDRLIDRENLSQARERVAALEQRCKQLEDENAALKAEMASMRADRG